MAEIGNCFHKYCLQCISVLLTSSSADEKSIGCVANECKTQICQRTLKEFSMSPMVRQKEVRRKNVRLHFVTITLHVSDGSIHFIAVFKPGMRSFYFCE